MPAGNTLALRWLPPLLGAVVSLFALACAAQGTPTVQALNPTAAGAGVAGTSTPWPSAQPSGSFPAPPDRDLRQLAAQLRLPPGSPEIPRVVNPEPVSYSEGHRDTFWLVDLRNMTTYQSDFELRLVSRRTYWYVEEGLLVDRADLERAATEFEDSIYPKVTRIFGKEWSPGVDNDPRLSIVHARLRGVGGYFGSADEHSQLVYSFSNQREIIYINAWSARPGSQEYNEVLAHELQHLVHWNSDPSEDTWLNEGLAELAVSVAGYSPGSFRQYLDSPTVSLVHWPLSYENVGANYAGAALFMHYLSEHYGPLKDLRRLVEEPSNGITGIDAYLEYAGYPATFEDVFRDWVVANLLDEPRGRYGYQRLVLRQPASTAIRDFTEFEAEIPQYAPQYLDLTPLPGAVRLRFQGTTENRLLPLEETDSRCWWSNSGDSISSSLSRSLDLRDLSQATLTYQVWYDLEEDWDYGYVEVSVNQGRNWEVLETPSSSDLNPIGNSFGPGYTGSSGGWVDQRVDLTPYADSRLLLRFHYVTDDAVNGAGLCLRRIAVPEAGLLDDDLSWQPDGFILTNNRVEQKYTVQVVRMGPENEVIPVPLDEDNAGGIVVTPLPGQEGLVVIVTAQAPRTRQPAPYTLAIEPATP
jgi:hypothetical protein